MFIYSHLQSNFIIRIVLHFGQGINLGLQDAENVWAYSAGLTIPKSWGEGGTTNVWTRMTNIADVL